MTNQNKNPRIASKRKQRKKKNRTVSHKEKKLDVLTKQEEPEMIYLMTEEEINNLKDLDLDDKTIMRINGKGELIKFADFPLNEVKRFFSKNGLSELKNRISLLEKIGVIITIILTIMLAILYWR
jgi:hypothetical protein